jgi:hypothetical protein
VEEPLIELPIPQLLLGLLGLVATITAALSNRRWLATLGVCSSLLVLVWTMVELDAVHTQLVAKVFSGPEPPSRLSVTPDPLLTGVPLIVGPAGGLLLAIASWVWLRLHAPGPERRRLRLLVLAGVCIIVFATLLSSHWELTYFYTPLELACSPGSNWPLAAPSAHMLERQRWTIQVVGGLLGAAATVRAVVWARQGVTPTRQAWAILLAFVLLSVGAKIWTADEREDTHDYFPAEPRRPTGREGASIHGPTLEHCSFEWWGGDREMIVLSGDRGPHALEHIVRNVKWPYCGGSVEAVILAEPEVPIEHVELALHTGWRQGYTHWGAVELHPMLVTRATTGEFVRYRSCVVDFTLDGYANGVTIEQFSTWGELAAAVDAAEGSLVIYPPLDSPAELELQP